MTASSDFFSILRRKTLKEPGEGFDRRFWARFNAEFSAPAPAESRWALLFRSYRLQLTTGVAALAIASAVFLTQQRDPFEAGLKAGVEPALLSSWTEIEAMEPDLEMLEALDESALSDSDWEILLKETV